MPLPIHETNQNIRVIAVAAGKGGVGKSTVTTNLARVLNSQGYRVGVLDADVYGPSIRQMLPEDQLPSQKGPSLLPAVCAGIRMLSMAYFRKANEATAVRAPIANGLIQQFLTQVEWGSLDFLLIDFPPGTGDVQLTLCQKAKVSGAVMVTTPQEVALMDVRKAIHLFEQLQVPLLGVVENMSYYLDERTGETHYLFGQGGGQRLSAECKIPFLGQIPISAELSACGDRGGSVFECSSFDAQIVSKAFQALAENVKKELAQTETSSLSSSEQFELTWQDPHTFTLTWKDGVSVTHRLSELQERCPCAGCVDETTGNRRPEAPLVHTDVRAVGITNVGRYALKIQFTSGCSSGIYPLAMLNPSTSEKYAPRNPKKT